MNREEVRKSLKSLEKKYRLAGRGNLAKVLQKQIKNLPIGGVHPEIGLPMLGHCGKWWIIDKVPFTTPCCGKVIDGQHEERDL